MDSLFTGIVIYFTVLSICGAGAFCFIAWVFYHAYTFVFGKRVSKRVGGKDVN